MIDKKEYQRLYYLANRDKKLAQEKANRVANPEKFKLKAKKYYERNKEKHKAYYKEYYKKPENREKARKSWREYNKKTTERRLYVKNKNYKRRVICKFTDIDSKWLNELFNKTTHCELCKCEMDNKGNKYPNGKQLDHITPLSAGGEHMKNNVRFICMKCNLERPKDGSDNLKIAEAQ